MKKYILLTLLAIVTLTSCEDYLNQNPTYSLTIDNSVTSYSSAKNIVNGIYGRYAKCNDLGGQLYSSLHCMAGMWTYSQVMYDMGYTQTGNVSTCNNIWSQLYSIVNASNAAIIGVSKLNDSMFPSVEEKNRLIAEAKAMRAFANLHLLWLFGHWFDAAESPYGIIYRDQIADLTNLMIGRSSVGDSYKYIIDDLDFAEKNLGNYESAHRMSRQMAQAMHAKLLLVRGWDGDYAEALKLVNEILSTAPAKFKMESDITKLYENGWNSNEVLFSRYLADGTNFSYSEFIYSYAFYYNPDFTEIPQAWLEEDERHDLTFGTARSPESWDSATKDNILTKMYHRGRVAGINDMYATYNIRYAELYLMKAELMMRANPSDFKSALAQINLMRSQYTNPVMSELQGVESPEDFWDALFKEYVVTLFMENETPWFASLRINHNGQPWIYTLKPDANISKNKFCWPIPDAEIIAHTNTIEQNPDLK